MIRRCVYCPAHHDFGETEPLDDHRYTHGMCPAAAVFANAQLDAWLAAEKTTITEAFSIPQDNQIKGAHQ